MGVVMLFAAFAAQAFDPVAANAACSNEAREQHIMGYARITFMKTCTDKAESTAPSMLGVGRAPNKKDADVATEAVANKLKDPLSAQFRKLTYHDSTHAICGEVNAKNSFGGYVGFRAFSYADGTVTMMPEGNQMVTAVFEKKIRENCE